MLRMLTTFKYPPPALSVSVSYRQFQFLHQKLLFSPQGYKTVAPDAELRGGLMDFTFFENMEYLYL